MKLLDGIILDSTGGAVLYARNDLKDLPEKSREDVKKSTFLLRYPKEYMVSGGRMKPPDKDPF